MTRTKPLPSLTSKLFALRIYLYLSRLDRYLREIVSTNKLARTWLDDVVEEDLADRVVTIARFTVVKDGKESRVKLVVENRIARLPD